MKKYADEAAYFNKTNTNHGDDQSEQTRDRHYLLDECNYELLKIEGLNHAVREKAKHKLRNEPSWRVVFLELPDDRKKDWALTL